MVVIAGPTGVGKSEVALSLARQLGGEIVCADSRQVYRGLDIGTDKPSASVRRAVPHHCLDLVRPDQAYSAGQYARDSGEAISSIHQRGLLPVLTGGTGLYIRAAIQGLAALPSADKETRATLKRLAEEQGTVVLHSMLAAVDADAAARIHPHDRVRLVRALEICRNAGRAVTQLLEQNPSRPHYRTLYFVLQRERQELYRRIDGRVERMLEAGLEAETRSLMAAGFGPTSVLRETIGYREMLSYIAGAVTLAEARNMIRQATRRYAKRQLCWFQKEPGAVRISVQAEQFPEQLVRAVQDWREEGEHAL